MNSTNTFIVAISLLGTLFATACEQRKSSQSDAIADNYKNEHLLPVVALYLPGPERAGVESDSNQNWHSSFVFWADGTFLARSGTDLANNTFLSGTLTGAAKDRLVAYYTEAPLPSENIHLFVDRPSTSLQHLYIFGDHPVAIIWDGSHVGAFARKAFRAIDMQHAFGLLSMSLVFFNDLTTEYFDRSRERPLMSPDQLKWLNWQYAYRTFDTISNDDSE